MKAKLCPYCPYLLFFVFAMALPSSVSATCGSGSTPLYSSVRFVGYESVEFYYFASTYDCTPEQINESFISIIYRDDTEIFQFGYTPVANTFVDSGLSHGTTYQYRTEVWYLREDADPILTWSNPFELTLNHIGGELSRTEVVPAGEI